MPRRFRVRRSAILSIEDPITLSIALNDTVRFSVSVYRGAAVRDSENCETCTEKALEDIEGFWTQHLNGNLTFSEFLCLRVTLRAVSTSTMASPVNISMEITLASKCT